jgi:hypothetical protein
MHPQPIKNGLGIAASWAIGMNMGSMRARSSAEEVDFVRCQISRPVASRSGPFAGFAIDVGTTPRRQRWRSGDWPASTGPLRIPRREARRANFPDMKRKVDYGREPDYPARPTKIVCQSNRPAQVRDVRAGRLIWHGTLGWATRRPGSGLPRMSW